MVYGSHIYDSRILNTKIMENTTQHLKTKVSQFLCKVGKRYCKKHKGLCDPEAMSFSDRCSICKKIG